MKGLTLTQYCRWAHRGINPELQSERGSPDDPGGIEVKLHVKNYLVIYKLILGFFKAPPAFIAETICQMRSASYVIMNSQFSSSNAALQLYSKKNCCYLGTDGVNLRRKSMLQDRSWTLMDICTLFGSDIKVTKPN